MAKNAASRLITNHIFLILALLISISTLNSSSVYAGAGQDTPLLKQLEEKCSPADAYVADTWMIKLDQNNSKLISNLQKILRLLSVPGFGLNTQTSDDPSQDTNLYIYFEAKVYSDNTKALEIRNLVLERLLLLSGGVDAFSCVPNVIQVSAEATEEYAPASGLAMSPDETGDGGVTGSNGSCRVVDVIDPIIKDGDKLPGDRTPIDWITKYTN